jgi:hypothetical protein
MSDQLMRKPGGRLAGRPELGGSGRSAPAPTVWGRRGDGRRLGGLGGFGWWYAAGSPEPAGTVGGEPHTGGGGK